MSLPSWTDKKYGSMKRGALWLVTVVGVGNVFTKTQLKEAFPETAQIDRRVRDLRDFGWRIDTNREDLSLDANEQRFVTQGEPVWEAGKGRAKGNLPITATQRREIMAKDGHICRSCGITVGQVYEGTYEAVQLDIARRKVRQQDGSTVVQLVTECSRCRVGGRDLVGDTPGLLARVRNLGTLERSILASWMESGQREFSALESIWAEIQTLAADSREQIRDDLAEDAGT
ncbi:hypothetical protein ACFYYY_18450 [Streptomyces sp. NPDC001834]|uniref:hypothetical protein n=1 Tax=Streptomyces sp. NPDC001834 TaxID=3364616 RepID=UPI0036AB6925